MAGMATISAGATQALVSVTDPLLASIRDLICRISGIFFPDNKLYFVADRCSRRMRALHVSSLAEYRDRLSIRGGKEAEITSLLGEITVGETCFFRYLPHLEALRNVVLPAILLPRQKQSFTHLRVWSAGCSTGEEAYTMAMVLQEEFARSWPGWTFEILATDLNESSLDFARQATYSDYTLRNTPLYFLQKYFRKRGGLYHVIEPIRRQVSFTRLNLVDDSKMLFLKGIDFIVCSNVLIYFGGDAKRRVIQHFFNNLLPGGYFFLGHSESLFGVNDDFKLVNFSGGTAYIKPARPMALAGAR